ncbi:HEAT repeat family protein [Kurthia sp. 11kri321]|uniref:conserved virulence factor C family protein n=1 Tax=unclassified Kurthia TaxID=2644826 RepID=UPI000745CD37|nr:conserved virulence factor C family protein [Kurthia sp. 11kri321]AMA64523.1 HEAT repeat family protein [Kurthia sp. 11kri321]
MQIKSIEPTPSPNTMKVILDQELPFGTAHNYRPDAAEDAPTEIQQILAIEGVKGVYHVADFLAVERNAKYDWVTILASVRQVFGEEAGEAAQQGKEQDHYGEAYVHIQMFKGIPLQVKVFDSTEEQRFALDQRYVNAFQEVLGTSDDDDFILQRKWVDYGVRYGQLDEIGQSIVAEIEATYPAERLQELVQAATEQREQVQLDKKRITVADLAHEDWEVRFKLLDQIPDPTVEDLPMLAKALEDEKMSIRRLATVYLGMIEDVAVVPYLERALQDKSASVRRTAGDCMSDLSLVEFEPAMIESLSDKNKLVRWRAAMFLYESGTEKALPALEAAQDDSEFEVSLQVKMAIERISQGESAKGSMWRQMTEMRKQSKD